VLASEQFLKQHPHVHHQQRACQLAAALPGEPEDQRRGKEQQEQEQPQQQVEQQQE
jgi:hypothetical protein